jgi:hypothetical protein
VTVLHPAQKRTEGDPFHLFISRSPFLCFAVQSPAMCRHSLCIICAVTTSGRSCSSSCYQHRTTVRALRRHKSEHHDISQIGSAEKQHTPTAYVLLFKPTLHYLVYQSASFSCLASGRRQNQSPKCRNSQNFIYFKAHIARNEPRELSRYND